MTTRAPLPVIPAKVAAERTRSRPADSPDDSPTTSVAGTAYSDGSCNWSWGYNSNGEVVKADHTGSGNTVNDRFYAFDGIGNRLQTRTGTFTTNGGTATVWTPNALNQYQTINSGTPVSPVHDDDGNLMADMGENLRGVALKYTWDAENRIIAVHRASDNALVAKYEYDFQSRRIRKEATSAAPQGAEAVTFIYHGWNPIAEYTDLSSVPTLHKAYSWGLDLSRSMQGAGGVGGLLAITDHRTATAGHYYPAFDGNGNLMQLYKDVGGTAVVQRVARFDYDPFGRIVREDGAYAAHLRIRFSTKYQDQETGFLYYGYRYFDPHTGRWPSRDPIGEVGGINLYGFVRNDGVNQWDYLGLIKANFHTNFQIALKRRALITYILGWEFPATLGLLDFEVNVRCTEEDEPPAGRIIGNWKINSAWVSNPPVSHSNIPSMKGVSGTLTDATPTIRVDLEAVA